MPIKRTIFLVDDDASVCNALSMFLESSGYSVRSFHSAETFLEETEDAAEGVILLDQVGIAGRVCPRLLDPDLQVSPGTRRRDVEKYPENSRCEDHRRGAQDPSVPAHSARGWEFEGELGSSQTPFLSARL